MSRIRYCEQCGSPLSSGMKFCENCGVPVPGVNETAGRNRQAPPQRRYDAGNRQAPPQRRYDAGNRQAPPQRRYDAGNRQAPPQSRYEAGNRQVPPQRRYDAGNRQVPPQSRYYSDMTRENGERKGRYRQEELESDWQQSWDRMPPEEDEQTITPVQYVLIGITVVLLIALIVFGVFWIVGRSSKKDAGDRNTAQTEALQTEKITSKNDDAITILDDTRTSQQTSARTETETSKQPETAAQDIVLKYQEFSVTLPASWQGKYGITQGAGYYSFYQQASKAKGYSGTLFTISRYTDTSYRDEPNYEVLGTGNGAAFIFSLPTDVQYATEDAAVSEEYRIMSNDIERIKGGIRVLVSGDGPAETEAQQPIEIQNPDQQTQTASSGGYISESSQRLITDADVSGMSYDDMQMAINEIYARHGRIFTTPEIKNYFESQSWYQGTVSADSFDESVFSATEAQNIQFLLGKMGVQQ